MDLLQRSDLSDLEDKRDFHQEIHGLRLQRNALMDHYTKLGYSAHSYTGSAPAARPA